MALSGAGFETHRAHRVAVSVSDKPLQYLSEKLSRNFDKFTKNNTKSPIETAILIRNNFSKIKQMPPYSRKYKTGTYKENRLNETGKYAANKENNLPAFQWSHRLNSKSIIQTKPQLCDKKLIYTTPEGTIGALNYKTGEVIWTKLYENYSPFARRGLTCEYNISIDTNVLYVPTSKGVLCLSPENGNTIESICNRGFIKSHKSFISPIIDKNNIYIATLQPAGVEARNINSGKLLWRTEFEVGSSYGGGGSNPWSGFTFDKKT